MGNKVNWKIFKKIQFPLKNKILVKILKLMKIKFYIHLN